MSQVTRAKPSRLSISDDSFSRFFWISAAIHFALFFGLTLKNIVMPSEIIVVQNAMRVDMVALPDKAEPQVGPSPAPPTPKPNPVAKPAEPEKPKPAPAPTPEKKISLEKKKPDPKQKQLEALNRLKQQEALENLTKAKKPSQAPPKESSAPKKNLNAGNQISRGDSVTGLERIAFDDYISGIKGTVNSNFNIPSYLADQKNKCSVEVVIDGTGRVTRRVLTRSSGNPAFDNAALSAVDASSPFPPVPERLTREWGSFTIQFNFPDT